MQKYQLICAIGKPPSFWSEFKAEIELEQQNIDIDKIFDWNLAHIELSNRQATILLIWVLSRNLTGAALDTPVPLLVIIFKFGRNPKNIVLIVKKPGRSDS